MDNSFLELAISNSRSHIFQTDIHLAGGDNVLQDLGILRDAFGAMIRDSGDGEHGDILGLSEAFGVSEPIVVE